MAGISSPYVTQGPRKPDPLDQLRAGVQLGAQMAQVGQMMNAQREEMVRMGFENLKLKMEQYPNYLKDSPDEVKKLIGLQYNINPNSPEVARIYNQWVTAMPSVALAGQIAAADALQRSTTAPEQPTPDRTRPETTPPQPSAVPVSGEAVVPQEETVAEKVGGAITYPEFVRKNLIAKNKQAELGGVLQPKSEWGTGKMIPQKDTTKDATMLLPESERLKLAYDNYLKSGVDADAYLQEFNRTGQFPDTAKLPREDRTIRTEMRTINRGNLKVADVENGVVRLTPEAMKLRDKGQVLTALKEGFYRDANETGIREILYKKNKDALLQAYGSEGKAIQALWNGEAFTKVSMKIADPVEMTAGDVVSLNGGTKTEAIRAERESAPIQLLTNRINADIDGGNRRWLSKEELDKEGDAVYGQLGAIGRKIKAGHIEQETKHSDRIIQNLGGFDVVMGIARRSDPKSMEYEKAVLELLKTEADIRRINAQTKNEERKAVSEERDLALRARESYVREFVALRSNALDYTKLSGTAKKMLADYTVDFIRRNPGAVNWSPEQWQQNEQYRTLYKNALVADLMSDGETTRERAESQIRVYEKQGNLPFDPLGLLSALGIKGPVYKVIETEKGAQEKGFVPPSTTQPPQPSPEADALYRKYMQK